MNKTAQRLFIFFIGIPLVIFLTAVSWCNHLPLHLTILAAATISVIELHAILAKTMHTHPLWLVIILTLVMPVSLGLYAIFSIPYNAVILAMTVSALTLCIWEIWGYDRNTLSFEKSLQRISSSLLILFYCGYLPSFISRMTAFDNSSAYISLFLLIVFGCDSCAWLFGITLGKSTRGYFKVSPNKSLVGFLGGFVGAFLAIVVGQICFPFLRSLPFSKLSILAVSTALTAIFGDLVESVFKRATNTKDSGKVIPGRGGILDSVDSIFFSAPIYYLLINLLFGL